MTEASQKILAKCKNYEMIDLFVIRKLLAENERLADVLRKIEISICRPHSMTSAEGQLASIENRCNYALDAHDSLMKELADE